MFNIQRLRLANMFPTDAGIQAPNIDDNQPDINEMGNKIVSLMDYEKNHDLDRQKQLINFQRQGHLQDIAAQQANTPAPVKPPMNYVFKDPNPTPYQAGQLEAKNKDIESREELGKAKINSTEKLAAAGNQIKQQRANVYDFKSKHPEMKIVTPKGGNFYAINPIDGSKIDLGIDDGTLSDEERLELTGEQRIGEIKARGTENRNTQEMKGNQNLKEIGARVQGQKDLQSSKPEKMELPTQTRTKLGNTARELINTRPEFKGYIKFDEQGNPSVMPPATESNAFGIGGTDGPTKEQFDEINKHLYGSGAPDKKTTPEGTVKKDPLGIR